MNRAQLATLGMTLRYYLWDSLTFPLRYTVAEKLIFWYFAIICSVRLGLNTVFGDSTTRFFLPFVTPAFDIFHQASLFWRIVARGLSMQSLYWWFTFCLFVFTIVFTMRNHRNEKGRIEPTYGPVLYSAMIAFTFFLLFTSWY